MAITGAVAENQAVIEANMDAIAFTGSWHTQLSAAAENIYEGLRLIRRGIGLVIRGLLIWRSVSAEIAERRQGLIAANVRRSRLAQ